MEEELKVAMDLLISEKQVSKDMAYTMLRADEANEVLTTRFGEPTVFLQEMLSLIGKKIVAVGEHYEVGNGINNGRV